MPDFTRVNLNKYSDAELTLPIIFGYLTYMSELMKLLCGRGRALLTKSGFLTHDEYKELFGHVFNLWNDLWQEKAVQKLFTITVEKGIASLADALQKDPNPTQIAYRSHPLWDWYISIEYQLQAGARLGIGSHGVTAEKSRQLIESMVPLVQRMQSEMALESIAGDRFPGDKAAKEAFVKANRNW